MKQIYRYSLVVVLLVTLTTAAFGAGVILGGSGLSAAASERPQFSTLGQVWDIVQERFVDQEVLENPTDLEYAAIGGLIEALGDEGHTRFLTPEERVRQEASNSGKFFGIGAMVGVKDGLPVIVAPFEGSPADRAGVKAGDFVIEVDGEDVTALSLGEVVDRVRGEKGTQVILTVHRPDTAESVEIAITRGEIIVPVATWAMVPGTPVALIRLSRFSANANEELTRALREAQEAGATGLIVDLRNNPGGLLEQSIQVTSQFLKDGNVLQQEDAQGNRKDYPVRKGGLATNIPLVVLVNQGSASSAEIFAGAIQDHERGPVVGETTFGTGTVLQPFDLNDGSELLLGTSQWLTADGRLIRKRGIEPDVAVELPSGAAAAGPGAIKDLTLEELLESEDAQLLKALELLNALPDLNTPITSPGMWYGFTPS